MDKKRTKTEMAYSYILRNGLIDAYLFGRYKSPIRFLRSKGVEL